MAAWLFVAIGVMTLLLRLGPLYMESMQVRSVMDSIAEDPDVPGLPKHEINRMLAMQLDINQVPNVKLSHFAYKRAENGGLELVLKYEVRRHIFFNIDAVTMFDYSVTIPPT